MFGRSTAAVTKLNESENGGYFAAGVPAIAFFMSVMPF